MQLAIVGTGYVGLVSGACLARLGHEVTCIDTNAARIESLKRGKIPFYEPGLEGVVADGLSSGRLGFSTVLDGVAAARAIFIAVGTPPRAQEGHADLGAVYAVARAIAVPMAPGAVIVTKSTVPAGTGDEVTRIVQDLAGGRPFAVVSNPEFLREGSAVTDFLSPDRVVVGAESAQALAVMREIYQPLTDRGVQLIESGRRTAELSKYAANAFLAMKVAFINEMADLCEKAGTNVRDIARIIGADSRIGEKFLRAGPGFGGSCFPKDTLSLIKTAQDVGSPLRLVEATIAANTARAGTMLRKIADACGGSLAAKRIAVWGLTFKPDTDDMRESPVVPIIAGLLAAGAEVCAYDPQGTAAARAMGVGGSFAADAYAAAENADALVLVTEWAMFRAPDYVRLARIMRGKVIVDLRNALCADDARGSGFIYRGIGLGVR